MARVTLGPGGVREIRGAVGEHVFRRSGSGTTVYPKPDMSGVERSEAVKASNDRFAKAVEYAKDAMVDPQLGPFYREVARRTNRAAFRVAISDYMLSPVVEEIDHSTYTGTPGDVIAIDARDDRQVAAVHVRLMDAEGAVLEEGPAERGRIFFWIYTVKVAAAPESIVRIEATAADIPGNTVTVVEEIHVPGQGTPRAPKPPTRTARGAEHEQARPSGRRRLTSEARRARHRRQRILPSPEVRLGVDDDPIRRGADDDPIRLAHLDSPTPDDVDLLSRIRVLLDDQDPAVPPISSAEDGLQENVRLALELLVQAERLLSIQAAGENGRAEPGRDALES